MDFTLSPAWGFIGVIVAILVGCATIAVSVWLRARKGLSYSVISISPLVTLNRTANKVEEALEIRYRGTPVHDVQVAEIRIWNSGNVPILKQDYYQSLLIELGGRVLAADVIDASPSLTKETIIEGHTDTSDEGGIGLNEVLLNEKDWFTIQVVLTNFNGMIKLHGRIVGVHDIRHVDSAAVRRAIIQGIQDSMLRALIRGL